MSEDVRRGGMRTLGAALPKAASPALRKRGFAQGAIVARWAEIVGPMLAAQSAPERLVFPREAGGGASRGERAQGAVLHIRASGAMALELQHLAPVVLERVNGFFGYAAVAKLTLHQAPLPRTERKKPHQRRPLAAEETQALDAAVVGTADEGLRSALRALGRRIAESQPARKKPKSVA